MRFNKYSTSILFPDFSIIDMQLRSQRKMATSSNSKATTAPLFPFPISKQNSSYKQYVIVAEDEWTIHKASRIAFNFAGLEWECTFTGKSIKLECKDIAKGKISEDVITELCIYDGNFNKLCFLFCPMRQVLGAHNKGVREIHMSMMSSEYSCIIMTIRILVERPLLPDFTLKGVQICGKQSNGQLRVGDQTFFINKEILSMFSNYFDRMYNGSFTEANKDLVNLESETCDPALFHDFLLTISLPGENVATLLELARFYDVELVRDKCAHHLKFCREMPREERIVLAKKYGLKEVSDKIIEETTTAEDLRKICNKFLKTEF